MLLIYTGINNLFNHKYSREIQRILQNDLEEIKFSDNHSHFSYFLGKQLNQTGAGEILEIINILISTILIIFYIISTYTYPEHETYYKNINKNMELIEIYLCVILAIHAVLKFYISQSRLLFIFDYINFIDYSSIICIFLSKTKFISYNYKFFFRLFRMIRIIYFFKLEYILQKRFNETVRYSYKLGIYLIAIIFLSLSIILEIENYNFRKENGIYATSSSKADTNKKSLNELFRFHDMIYFELVTLTTIGFGDITPKMWTARFIIIVTFLSLLILVLPVYSKLKIIFALTSKYSRMSYQKKNRKIKHLFVLGDCGVESYEAFLKELYNDDHGTINYDTVIMQSSPNEELMKLIKDLTYNNKIYYLVGNSLVHKDLERCSANESICAIILANKLAKNPKYEDFSNIMKAFSFRKFSYINGKGHNTRICIQLLLPETKEIYYNSLINYDRNNSQDQIICIEELKLQLLGKSCLCQGITTIISALITSEKPPLTPRIKFTGELDWLNEYLYGIQLEIYVITLKAELIHNMKFIDVVKLVYEVSDLVVIGIDVIIDDIKPFVCLNPASYLLSPFDNLVYVLADRQPDDEEINDKIREHLEKNQKGVVENNMEMVKLLRLKNPYWNKMANNSNVFKNNFYKNNNTNTSNENNNNLNNSTTNINSEKINDVKYKFILNNNTIDTGNIYKKKLDMYSTVKQNFFHTILPRTQHEAESFNPDILDHHIIVCGIGFNLKNLLMPLRASSMKNEQYPILIIDKAEHIPSEIWKEIQYYPNIYFMQGNPIKSKDLQKARVKKAKAIIILSKSTTDVEQADMVDADTIFIYKAIKNETKSALIIAELVSVSAISFINNVNEDNFIRKQGYWLSQPFAVGEMYISSMLDTLICQAFYNPYITEILQQLIMGSAGSNFSPSFQKKLQEKKITQSTLYLLNINDELIRLGYRDFQKKMQYKELFQYFSKNNMIPIGINRNSAKLSKIRNKQEKRYVYLCPKKTDLVDIEHDKIYILASEDYFSKQKVNDPYKNKNNNFYQFNKTNKLIDKSNELVLDLAQSIKKLVEINTKNFAKAFSIKKVVNNVRNSIRTELADLYDKLVDNYEEMKENNSDKKNSDSENESSQNSKDNSSNKKSDSKSEK